ncbi:hypothetical protein GVY41_07645 [Frigidibacter albus]|uniref:Uncharacterized protein n=1 Tax=Frigidibacter albus TaxID=1465486 RepID=A0A6L8VFV6_9RHOB|nr:hypothetical protein [Frigidibacter albus]MZQ89074.1 hypothetical protein [Frigidibacter albus]NBE30869.1 hypothetical protein [Frigidibacter albus]GGH51604.1 hypothetical protein GCM10011341_15350 [Frigidibacter albus]
MNDQPPEDGSGSGESGSQKGTILRARNGDVIGYDASGLVMRLSDKVIADIGRRLGALPAGAAQAVQAEGLDPSVLGDVDAWNLRQTGEWYVFSANLPGEQGARQYRCLVEADSAEEQVSIVADAPGALLGVFSLGGARATKALPRVPRFPYHILAPADDIGAVGMGGVEPARVLSHLNTLREVTRDALLAEVLLADRRRNHRALPLYMVRAETDGSPSVAALREGQAVANLLTAARSLKAAADRMAKPARILCIRLDYTLEDVQSDAVAFRDGMLALLDEITEGVGKMGFHKPVFLATFDCGTPGLSDHPALRAQWDLAWNHGEHDLVFAAPGYGFAQDSYGRPTPEAMLQMAEMDALAVTAIYEDRPWFCPTFLLAEREGERLIRVRARALGPLVIDAADPFGAGPTAGFRLEGQGAPHITQVALAEDDPQDLLLSLDAPATDDLHLLYGFSAAPRAADDPAAAHPAAAGSLRDDWQGAAEDGTPLHRWALPCALPVH